MCVRTAMEWENSEIDTRVTLWDMRAHKNHSYETVTWSVVNTKGWRRKWHRNDRERETARQRADSRDEIKATNVRGKTKKKKPLLPAAVQTCSLVPKSKTHPARPRAANHAAAEPSKAHTCDSSVHGVILAGRLPYEAVQLCARCMLRTKIKATKNCITILHQVKVSR